MNTTLIETTAAPPAARDKRAASFQSLDAARGIACLWVVFFHAITLVDVRYPQVGELPFANVLFSGYVGVQVFFVVSGYCIINAAIARIDVPAPTRTFLVARLRRILPPCWCSLLLYAIAAIAAEIAAHYGWVAPGTLASLRLSNQSLAFMLSNITLTQILFKQHFLSIVCWTLCYEMAFYLVVAVAIFLATNLLPKKFDRRRALLTTLHVITLLTCAIHIFAAEIHYPFDLWPCFGLGVLTFDVLHHPRKIQPRLLYFAAAVLLLLAVALNNHRIGFTLEPSRNLFFTAIGTSALLLLLFPFDRLITSIPVVAWTLPLGRFSYSLYLTNFLIIPVVLTLANFLLPPRPSILLLLALIVIAALIATAFGCAFYYVCERPFINKRRPVTPVSTAP